MIKWGLVFAYDVHLFCMNFYVFDFYFFFDVVRCAYESMVKDKKVVVVEAPPKENA